METLCAQNVGMTTCAKRLVQLTIQPHLRPKSEIAVLHRRDQNPRGGQIPDLAVIIPAILDRRLRGCDRSAQRSNWIHLKPRMCRL